MSRAKKPKLNNRGASLIFVIIGFVFVIALCSIVISSAITNVQMKTINKKSKQNFYSAEKALDELKVSISENVAEAMAVAYQKVLGEFSGSTETTRKALLEETFTDMMKSYLSVSGNQLECAKLNHYLKETKLDPLTGNGAVIRSADDTGYLRFIVNKGDSITIQGIQVVYTKDGYISSITTDMKIMFPSASFVSPIGVVENRPYVNYALIAAQGLWAATTSHMIRGNVAVGKEGINVSLAGHTLTILDGLVISEGDITVKDKASFVMKGDYSELWTNNLATSQTYKTDKPHAETTININGNTYVKDDLILNAYNSRVVLSGEYYGFSSGEGPENNSAIMINMASSFLKMDDLRKLTLAGRAYIKTSSNSIGYDTDTTIGVDSGMNKDILTGESLTVKGSQSAYLLPAEYIAVGHNPVSWEEYRSYYNSHTPMYQISDSDVIFNSPYIYENERKLSDYVDLSDPVTCVFYKFGSGASNVVYYYLKFKSEKLATTYFKNYSICYPDRVYNGFPIDLIQVRATAGTYITAGNLITYETGDNKVQVLRGNNADYVNDYARQYNNLVHTLQKNVPSSKPLIENILNLEKIRTDGITHGGGQAKLISNGSLEDGTPYYVNIMDGSFTLSEAGKQGIIVATGDVVLNSSFTGMIISGGNITLGANANFSASSTLVTNIFMENPDICQYFIDMNPTSGTFEDWKAIDVSELIVFDNWRKN